MLRKCVLLYVAHSTTSLEYVHPREWMMDFSAERRDTKCSLVFLHTFLIFLWRAAHFGMKAKAGLHNKAIWDARDSFSLVACLCTSAYSVRLYCQKHWYPAISPEGQQVLPAFPEGICFIAHEQQSLHIWMVHPGKCQGSLACIFNKIWRQFVHNCPWR